MVCCFFGCPCETRLRLMEELRLLLGIMKQDDSTVSCDS